MPADGLAADCGVSRRAASDTLNQDICVEEASRFTAHRAWKCFMGKVRGWIRSVSCVRNGAAACQVESLKLRTLHRCGARRFHEEILQITVSTEFLKLQQFEAAGRSNQ